MGQDVYTLHAQAVEHFPMNGVLVNSINKQLQINLADICEYSTENDSVRYLLTCTKVFSKYAKERGLSSVAYNIILGKYCKPTKIQMNAGTDFCYKH